MFSGKLDSDGVWWDHARMLLKHNVNLFTGGGERGKRNPVCGLTFRVFALRASHQRTVQEEEVPAWERVVFAGRRIKVWAVIG